MTSLYVLFWCFKSLSSKSRHSRDNVSKFKLFALAVDGWYRDNFHVVTVVSSANPENDQYRRPADPSRPSQIGPQAYLVLDVFSNKVSSSSVCDVITMEATCICTVSTGIMAFLQDILDKPVPEG